MSTGVLDLVTPPSSLELPAAADGEGCVPPIKIENKRSASMHELVYDSDDLVARGSGAQQEAGYMDKARAPEKKRMEVV